MRSHGNDFYPVIHSRRLEVAVFDYLIDHPIPLTGSQVSFVRKYMDMTQQQFAKVMDLSNHSRVSQWERTKDKIADIRPVYLAALRARMAKYRGRELFTRRVEGILEKLKTIKCDSAA